MQIKSIRRTVIAATLLGVFGQAGAQSASDATPSVVVLGSRAPAKGALDTAVPVGLVSASDMQSTGMLELGKVLQDLDPSFNFSTTFISDGTDIIRPATLRGLGPDQLLVLVNGKRRHQQALVNVQQTIGRGSAGTDINAIPLSAIDHIEVLRDGAAAQYGSDAIAGVINIVLKKGVDEGSVSATAASTAKGDGHTWGGSAHRGFALGDGYLDLSLEGRRRGETNRAGPDLLRVAPPRVTQRIGDSLAKDAYLWLNSALPTSRDGEFYAFGGVSRRTGDAGGFFRPRGDARNVPEVYPEGFLPNIRTTVRDASLAIGYRHDLPAQWNLDLSVNHGRNELAFHERNSINVSYWYEPKCSCSIYAESPREADTGKLRFDQTTVNVDIKGPMKKLLGLPTYIAAGAEYRHEGYQIVAGEPVSYQYGRTNDTSIKILDQTGHIAAAGIQGFPGYTPSTEVNEGRHSAAIYLDIEQTWHSLMMGSAIRRERYSDFGFTTTGKTTLRWDPVHAVGLRASMSTGFRAPGVQQKFYSSVSTNLNSAGVLTDTLTAREGSPVTKAFGIAPLRQEVSRGWSGGVVLRPARGFALTADVYRTQIYDRIVFSSTIEPESGPCPTPAACPIKTILTPLRVGQAQFFTNAIDTDTRGLDILAEQTLRGSGGSKLVLSAQIGLNRTEVMGRHSYSPVLTGAKLFDDAQVTLIEHGQPRQHHVVAADYSTGPWELTARANWFGSVQGQGFTAPFIQTWEGRWLLDLTARYAVNRQFSLSAGVDNVFDTYPTRWDPARAAPFPQLGFNYCWETCPFGINGRSMFLRADYRF